MISVEKRQHNVHQDQLRFLMPHLFSHIFEIGNDFCIIIPPAQMGAYGARYGLIVLDDEYFIHVYDRSSLGIVPLGVLSKRRYP